MHLKSMNVYDVSFWISIPAKVCILLVRVVKQKIVSEKSTRKFKPQVATSVFTYLWVVECYLVENSAVTKAHASY